MTANDVLDAGLQHDKLPLLYLENSIVKIAIKSAEGISKRINIEQIIMVAYYAQQQWIS